MSRWTVARADVACFRCEALIVAGEQYRQFGPRNLAGCLDCAKKATGEDPPAHMPEAPRLPKLKEPDEWFPVKALLPSVSEVMPPLASRAQRERILAARRRLERPAAGELTPLQQQERERWWER